MNENFDWRSVFGRANKRLKDQEIIIRFLALYFDSPSYEEPMKEFLNKFTKRHRNDGHEFLESCDTIFNKTITIVRESIGDRAFRPERAFNVAAFDSIMVGIAKRLDAGTIIDKDNLKKVYDNLLEDSDFLEKISRSTANEKFVAHRLKRSIEAFGGI